MGIFDSVKNGASGLIDQANNFLSKGIIDDITAEQSEWLGLNRHLLAKFYRLKSVGSGKDRQYVREGAPVIAPILDGAEFEYSFNWQQPFEQMGTETKAPALTAMLQSGALSDFWNGFQAKFLGAEYQESNVNQGLIEGLAEMEGRTGITKLNSTQTFAGMPPIKCSMKLLFRAWRDPQREVMNPISQLLQWAVPQNLSPNGSLEMITDAAYNSQQAGELQAKEFLHALMPSTSPCLIAMEYKNRIYSPLVIEQISDPITSPTTADGHYARAEISLTVASLTAWDKQDILNIYGGSGLINLGGL